MKAILSLSGVIARGARSKYFLSTVATKDPGVFRQMFHNPNTGAIVMKEISGLGVFGDFLAIRTTAYSGSRLGNFSTEYLKSHPEAFISAHSFPANKIVERATYAGNNLLSVYKNGKTTEYRKLSEHWIKGPTVPTPHTADKPTYF